MLRRPSWGAVTLVLFFGLFSSARLAAQGSAKELIAELRSGDSTRCMNAGNSTSEYQEHYQALAAELATPLFDILQNGPCSRSALTALVNVGRGIAEGIDNGHAIAALVSIVDEALAEGASYESVSDAGSAILVVGHFGAAGAPAVPVLERWVLGRSDSFERRYALDTLAEIGDAAAPAVPRLLPLLSAPAEDDEEAWAKQEVRTAVARMLGSIPSAVAASGPALVAGLSDADYSFRYAASESLGMIGAPAVPYLLPALATSDAEVKGSVLDLFSRMGAAAADAAASIAPLLAHGEVSYQAGDALREIGPTSAGIAALVKVLGQEDNEDAAATAAGILGGYGSAAKDALPALRKAAGGDNWWVADSAKSAIAEIEGGG